MFFCFECCVLSGRGFCDGLTTRPEESCRLWRVVVCDLETSWMRKPWPTRGCCATKKKYIYVMGCCNFCSATYHRCNFCSPTYYRVL
jgi:hypothetical protein